MFLKAINMFRSLRRSEFNINEEKEGCRSDFSKGETSPGNSATKDSATDDQGVDKINNSHTIQYRFNSIQPRASIRTKDIDLIDLKPKSTPKMSANSVKRKACPVSPSQNGISDDDDDDVVIIKEISTQNEVGLKKSSFDSTRSNKVQEEEYSKKELLCVDDDPPGPLVIDLEDTVHAEEKCSSDSQSSYYTSPQELFDLCENELEVCKVNEMHHIQEKKKNGDEFKGLCEIVAKKIIDTSQALKNEILLQSKLHDVDPPAVEMDCVSETTTAEMMLKSAKNVGKRQKRVKDSIVRLKLPIKGTNKKKFFLIKTSILLSFVKYKYHPLHMWHHLLTLENINDLSKDEKMKIIKILAGFIEVKVMRSKRKQAV